MSSEEQNEIRTQLAVLSSQVTGWMETTTEYRKSLCSKVDVITLALSDLPCKERKAWYQSIGRQVQFMWLVMSLILVSVIGSAFVTMKERNQVLAEISIIKNDRATFRN